jgi:hemerythrin
MVALGVPELDEQHREILRRVDALIHAIRGGSSRDEVGRTLAFLREHVATHFGAEEALMRDVGFPGLAPHRREHEGFVRDLRALETDHARHGPTPALVLRVKGHLRSWLDDHLFKADGEIAAFLRARA